MIKKENNKMNSFYDGKEILITGGTGSLGKTICKKLLKKYKTKGIRLFSRDEAKQQGFKNELKDSTLSGNVAFLIGDIRDKIRFRQSYE